MAPAVYRGGYGGGYYRHHGGGGFIPGAVAGAVVGGALASSYGYYGGPGYYAPGYYDDGYYDDGAVAVEPLPVATTPDTARSATNPTIRLREPISAMTVSGIPARNRI